MDWGVISEATFFLSVALLAVVVTIFVLSISLLGMAIESEELEKKAKQEKLNDDIKKEKGQVEKKLKNDALGNSLKIGILREDLSRLEKKLKKGERKLLSIQNKYKQAFSVTGAVATPGICFISSIVLSTLTWSLLQQNPTFYVGGFHIALLLIPAGAAIIFGIYRMMDSLVIVREVSTVSEQLILRRNIDAYKKAHEEIESEESPIVVLESENIASKIRVTPEENFDIHYHVSLSRGKYAEALAVTWYAPPVGFDFVSQGTKGIVNPRNDLYPNYKRYTLERDLLLQNKAWHCDITIKAPKTPGSYKLAYIIDSKGFNSGVKEFDVQVK